uniref:Uncharacterized protein n=1 Tax=Glossina palpalis gambiensis TaxID=67801 RepID=A0A1B0B8G3_9MUSC
MGLLIVSTKTALKIARSYSPWAASRGGETPSPGSVVAIATAKTSSGKMNNLDHVKNFYPENYKLDLSETMKAALSKGGSNSASAGVPGSGVNMLAPSGSSGGHSSEMNTGNSGLSGAGYVTEKLYMLLQLYLQNKGWNPSAELLQCFSDLKDNAMLPSAAYLQVLASRLTLDAQGRLILRENGKIVLPYEHFANAVMLKHMSGPHGLHLSVDATVRAVMESYTIGRENFGMEKEFIIEVVQSCPNAPCRYYKNHIGISPLPFIDQQFPGVNPSEFLQHLPHLPPPPPPTHSSHIGSGQTVSGAGSGPNSAGSSSSTTSSSAGGSGEHFDPTTMAVAAAAANLQMQGLMQSQAAAVAAAAVAAGQNSAAQPSPGTSLGLPTSNNNNTLNPGNNHHAAHHQLPPPTQSPTIHSSRHDISSSTSVHSVEQMVQKSVETLRYVESEPPIYSTTCNEYNFSSNLESLESNKDLLALHNGAWTSSGHDSNSNNLPVGQDKIIRIFSELMRNMSRIKTYIRPSMCKPYGKQSESLQKTLVDTIQIIQTLRSCLPAPHIPVTSWKSESEGSSSNIGGGVVIGGTSVSSVVCNSMLPGNANTLIGSLPSNRIENLSN